MKRHIKIILIVSIVVISAIDTNTLRAGNPDRSGQAGAYELLINPWARSTGWGSVNTSCVRGLEGIYQNVAGLAFTKKTELIFSHTIYLKGSDININSFGISQKVGSTGALGLAVMSMGFGDIPLTTYDDPDGGIGNFSPKYMNINIAYAKAFSNSIFGGINFKIISESISDLSAQGLAIDAGIQYVTGELENIKFGLSLKNVGTRLSYTGSGLSFRGLSPEAASESTVEQRAADFELPSLLNIGGAYDFTINKMHTLTVAANFTSNSFTKDQYILGLEYGFASYLFLRAGFTYEDKIFKDMPERTTVYTGPSFGFSIDVPLNKEKGSKFSFDYSYRTTNPFNGNHCIGAKISL